MKKYIYHAVVLFTVSIISSCTAIVGIFKAGAVMGIVAVVIIIIIITWVISIFRGRN